MKIIPNPILSVDSSDPENVITTHAEGVFAIDHIERPELAEKLYLGGNHMMNSGAPTFCYRFDSKEEYESFFPPVVEDVIDTIEVAQPEFDVESARKNAIKLLFKVCDRKFKALVKDYPIFETTTWGIQRAEADGLEPSTFIENAVIEGESVDELKATIQGNSQAFRTYAGQISKFRRENERLINTAETQTELNEIIGGFL